MPCSRKVLSVLLILHTVSAKPANAGIVCDGAFQIVDGHAVATPYCEDEQLARSLRARGVKTSGAEVRANPELKREICLMASSEPSLDAACASYAN
jgi:hypothetical protein